MSKTTRTEEKKPRYIRIPDATWVRVCERAKLETRKPSEVLRMAVQAYVKKRPEKPKPVVLTPSEEAGEWLLDLDDDIRAMLFRIGESLQHGEVASPPEPLRKALGIRAKRGR